MADEYVEDPTLRRCILFAKRWDYDGVVIANLFAFRATKPPVLWMAKDPVGPMNDHWISESVSACQFRIAGWGNHGNRFGRAEKVLKILGPCHCLKRNKSGLPAHPLYVLGSMTPVKYEQNSSPSGTAIAR